MLSRLRISAMLPVPIPELHWIGLHATWPRIDRSGPFFAGLRRLPILSYGERCSATIEACGGRGMRASARHVRAFFHLKLTVR
jgi:hypothetical protein